MAIAGSLLLFMIYGVGIDLVKTDRIRNAIERWGDRFLKKIFTDSERSYCYEKKNPYLSFAVRFAAKEAMIKAIGSGIGVAFNDIEIVNDSKGMPRIEIKGKLKNFFKDAAIKKTSLSLSHERDYGIACVVLEK